jgi:WD40 repeat protein
MYAQGLGVEKNNKEAARWFRMAADQGHALARKELMSLRPPETSLFQMFRSKGGAIVALALPGKGTVKLYNERGEVGSLNGHTRTVTCAAFTPDGTRGVTGSEDRTVCVWEIATRRLIRQFKAQKAAVSAVAISADGKTVLSAEGTVAHVWNVRTDREVGRPLTLDHPITCLAFLPGGRQAVCAVDTTPTFHVWNLSTFTRTPGPCSRVAYSAIGVTPSGFLVGGNRNGAAILVSLPNNRTKEKVKARSGARNLQRISFSGNWKVVLFEAGTQVRVFTISDGAMKHVKTLVQKDNTRGPYAASLDKDGARLTYADRDLDGSLTFKTESTR